jgi:hypothetical protein
MPPSVRFWGRKVYWAPVVLLAAALRQNRPALVTLQRLKSLFGPWRSTVRRWQRYFLELFPNCTGYRRLSGRLMPPIANQCLPAALLARFCQNHNDPQSAIVSCLRALVHGP